VRCGGGFLAQLGSLDIHARKHAGTFGSRLALHADLIISLLMGEVGYGENFGSEGMG